jgi:hypothetical protein
LRHATVHALQAILRGSKWFLRSCKSNGRFPFLAVKCNPTWPSMPGMRTCSLWRPTSLSIEDVEDGKGWGIEARVCDKTVGGVDHHEMRCPVADEPWVQREESVQPVFLEWDLLRYFWSSVRGLLHSNSLYFPKLGCLALPPEQSAPPFPQFLEPPCPIDCFFC